MKGCREVAAELGLDVPEGPYLPADCCESCHEDDNLGYMPLADTPDGTARVCCAILRMMPDE